MNPLPHISNLAPDRTKKQPRRFMCVNPRCGDTGQSGTFERFQFNADKDTCPKCKGSGYPYVVLMALVHLLIPDPQGRIMGGDGRYRMACDPSRHYLATTTNQEAATGDPEAVNCPGCLEVIAKASIQEPTGSLIVPSSDESIEQE